MHQQVLGCMWFPSQQCILTTSFQSQSRLWVIGLKVFTLILPHTYTLQ